MEISKRTYQKHKTAVKITVKHQLNASAKPDVDDTTGELIYPIYVTVSVNGQFTRFKSRLRQEVAQDKLEDFLSIPANRDFAENERRTIEDSINLFNPGSKKDFKLTDWSKYYSNWTVEISTWVDYAIDKQILDMLEDKYDWSADKMILLPTNLKAKFSVLSMIGINEVSPLLEDYSSLLDLEIYETVIRLTHNHNHLYCLWDYYSGYYQHQLSLLMGDKAKPIINQLDKMRTLMVDY